ncbi:MAG: hypothetical protein K6B41_00585, partial [Butyrivibrio sp.]|nr:hypothetical protein [Butyrivibrio sp.]
MKAHLAIINEKFKQLIDSCKNYLDSHFSLIGDGAARIKLLYNGSDSGELANRERWLLNYVKEEKAKNPNSEAAIKIEAKMNDLLNIRKEM